MKKLYAFLWIAFSTFVVQAQIVNIPDVNFKHKLLHYTPAIDWNHDGEIQVGEASAVINLDLKNATIADFTGLEAFVNIRTLDLSSNFAPNVNLAGFPNLQSLSTGNYGGLQSLTLSNLPNLKSLDCSQSQMTSLTMTGLDNLKKLDCSFTHISEYDFSGAVNLDSLNVSYCQLMTNLDVSGLTNLKYLYAGQSGLASINLSGLSNLDYLDCSGSELTTIDLTGLSNLKHFFCVGNNIQSLSFPGLTSLETLYCGQNPMTSLDVSMVPNLKIFNCGSAGLTSLNVTGLSNLLSIQCANNNLTELDLTGLTSLNQIECWKNHITALSFTGLNSLESIYCKENNLTALDLTGLNNLSIIDCQKNQLTSFNLAQLPNLTEVNCNENALTTLDASNLVKLLILECYKNQLSSINLTNLPKLSSLNCRDNQLPTIDLSNLPVIDYLECSKNLLTTVDLSQLPSTLYILGVGENQLTTIDVAHLTNLTSLGVDNNQLTDLDVSHQLQLMRVKASNNLFTTLDFSFSQSVITQIIDASNNPNLTYLNVKNGSQFKLHHGGYFSAANCPNLHYICADERNFQYINVPGAQVNSYCSFVPGGIFNTISGTLTFDLDNNGCDAADTFSMNNKMKINNGFVDGVGFANASGHYVFQTGIGNFTVSPEFENPYFTISPQVAEINFATLDGSTQTQDFCITPNGVHNDVEVTIVANQDPRPGFDATYSLVYKNKGNQILSGNINLNFDEAVLDLVTANPNISNQALNQLTWSYSNLKPFESRTINFTLNVNSPQEIPAVNNGDILHFTAVIDPIAADETTNDNTFHLNQTVRGSYDPNDKTCLEGTTMTPEMVGDYLHYVIRFQNSGTAAAENIVVTDVIDTAKFDMASLQLIGASHPHETKVRGNKIEFIFENINLPAEIDNEPASHGFVSFKIKTKNNLVLGTEVTNIADIYFDYNFPITTEPATTTVSLLSNTGFDKQSVSVYPNPVKNSLHINAKDKINSVALFDMQGRLVATKIPNDTTLVLDMSNNRSGIYFVKIYTDKGTTVEKVIKE